MVTRATVRVSTVLQPVSVEIELPNGATRIVNLGRYQGVRQQELGKGPQRVVELTTADLEALLAAAGCEVTASA